MGKLGITVLRSAELLIVFLIQELPFQDRSFQQAGA